jgi:hypothetical protein
MTGAALGGFVPVAALMGRGGGWVLDAGCGMGRETLGAGLNSSQVGAGRIGLVGAV